MPSHHCSLDWHPEADRLLRQSRYLEAITFYEALIAAEPGVTAHFWHLGLLLLLQGNELDAQAIWLMAMAEGEDEAVAQWTQDLLAVLGGEADRRAATADQETAWLIRQHMREIAPEEPTNVAHLILLSAALDRLDIEALASYSADRVLANADELAEDLLLKMLDQVLAVTPHPLILDIVRASLPHIHNRSALRAVILPQAIQLAYSVGAPQFAADLLNCYLSVDPNNVEVLGHLALFYQNAEHYTQGIATAQLRLALSDHLAEQIFSSHLLLRGLLGAGGRYPEGVVVLEQHQQLLQSLIAQAPNDLHPVHVARLFNACYYMPYFGDEAFTHRTLQNQIVQLCQANIAQQEPATIARYRQSAFRSARPRRLKVGYMSHCLGRHSVGWLARWLIQHHDRDRIELHGYFVNQRQGDWQQVWYLEQMEQTCLLGVDCPKTAAALAERIDQDKIDVLIDLDSITLDLTCEVLALKPAPIQATWLGWDAVGLSTIDYFIADPYVLPETAQSYYAETIWRLPQTYVAVDGFEVGVPTLRRDQLGIAADAIIYLTAQRGYKRHPDTARRQMQILKAVPNSHLLIKGFADAASIQQFFITLAEEVGVAVDRLHFLPDAASEAVHRANLQIADVVLDTFPYNGATTTLETLWMGIPLVTQVGQQFAARNSYTMMINAGITEGIAWTDDDYIEWGIRLGNDAALRQKIAYQLRQSRHNAPLWNARKFAREMEIAYGQMWDRL